MVDIEAVLKVVESLVEAPCLYTVSYPPQFFILMVDFGNNGALVCFKLVASFVVAAVLLNFCIGGRVVESMGHFSQ